MTDAELAHGLAEEAGKLLLRLREGHEGGKALGDEGDRVANRLILDRLRIERPDDAILSEEEKDNPARCGFSRAWVIDPLDGTREYSEGRNDWAVHVALAVDGRPVAGAVALPGLGLTLASDRPPALIAEAAPLRMLVSRTRPAPEALAVAERLGATLVPMGSAGAKAMAVLRGEADIYLHTGGQYEWDNCAPAAVAMAAGLHVSRVDGSELVYNCADPWLPDLLICHRHRAAEILAFVADMNA
ncbi:3'(2'),5'-bisphosphate nucleotidase CysQ [Sphingomonas colocasiae]|uniref:3'(2'),5-bisphosphonucleoside 3'(2')-phosphohydrolase n=1 Tax=Sphingomonas colocasiae TaxID=1848973 RepID=A0ABS7PHL2_9SPHN|nr:3'(2'),5'-bisphosphate nucleotidase CysQ [Sphingomonas colocasiae]